MSRNRKQQSQASFNSKLLNIPKSRFRFVHGGDYRKKRKGRRARSLSTNHPHHIVFKINSRNLMHRSFRHPKNFNFVQKIMKKYASRFMIKIESISYQHNHIHLIIRAPKRRLFHNFFRVFCGQIAQKLKIENPTVTDTPDRRRTELGKKLRLWAERPFSRIVVGKRAYRIVKAYVKLNECEVLGLIPYRKERLRGLTELEWLMIFLE